MSTIYEFQSGDYLLNVEADSYEEALREIRKEFPEGMLVPIHLSDLIERIDKVENSPIQITEDGIALQLAPGFWTMIGSNPEANPEEEALLIHTLINDARRRGARVGSTEFDGRRAVT